RRVRNVPRTRLLDPHPNPLPGGEGVKNSNLDVEYIDQKEVMVKTAILQAHGLVLLSTLLVAGSFIAAAPLAQLINPYSLTLLRFLLAALILAPVVLLNSALRSRVLPALPRTLIISFLFSTFFVCMFEALQTTSSLNTAAIYTLVPMITAIISVFLLGERFTLTRILAYGLGIVGACWVIFQGDLDAFLSLRLNRG